MSPERTWDTAPLTLDELALKHGTDKSSLLHGYADTYERYLEPLRNEPITLLELGWGGHEAPDQGGESARMWREYLPLASVNVVDLHHKSNMVEGVTYWHGAQQDPTLMARIHGAVGAFDVIIDDASHQSSLTIRSFEILYPYLRPGGLYVVEDTHASYHAEYYGQAEADPDPAQDAHTAMGFFKRLADEVNHHGDGDWDLYPTRYWQGYGLEFIHFYFNLLVAQRRSW
jgi:8-demethyl-8-(2-methoxy-alpha-L-rhamnosyl)tetracenomycin-C 3'-O-methyltransferase